MRSIPPLSFFFGSPTQLAIISAVNALIFTLLMLRTQLVLSVVGRVAGPVWDGGGALDGKALVLGRKGRKG